MKKIFLLLFVTSALNTYSQKITDATDGNYQKDMVLNATKNSFDPGKEVRTYTLTFWCNFKGSGPIYVYVNDVYRGKITTAYYTTIPDCDCDGCVSVDFSSTGTLTYYATDGENQWGTEDDPKEISIYNTCKTMNLHL